jgi:type VI secretion system secreted protein Hcp
MADDYYLKIDGVQGESTDQQHPGEIQLESWSFGESNPVSPAPGGAGIGAGKVHMQDFRFATKIDKAGPPLFLACATGKHIPSVVLTCRKAGGTPLDFLRVTLNDVVVSSYGTSSSGGGEVVPTEEVSLAFSKITFEYQVQRADGSGGGWEKSAFDLKQSRAA